MTKPKIRILRDDCSFWYCGLFTGGYSSIARVGGQLRLDEVINFYFKVLKYDRIS